jgi:hypothetical protein
MDHAPEDDREVELRLPSQSNAILSDVWLGIVTGSCSAEWPTTVVARGVPDLTADSQFFSTPAGLAAIQTARAILPEGGRDRAVEMTKILHQLIAQEGGLIPTRGGGQILLEADPDFPIAPVLRAGSSMVGEPSERRRMFAQLVLSFRKKVEIGALRRAVNPVSEGPAGAVGRFLFELHENGLEHGSRDGGGRKIRGSRTLRIRKHVANRPGELAARHGNWAELQVYLERVQATALVEASVSDFGLGIVDGFLATPQGTGHRHLDRRDLLDSLLFERLSSKGLDPASGLGIQRALRAASQMQAFVSVRTAEFWLSGSFLDGQRDVRLSDVGPVGPRAAVRGTHWQILWPQP